MCMGRVLVADPDHSTCELLREALGYDGFEVAVATERAEALALGDFDVVVADIDLDLLGAIKARAPGTEVIVTTSSKALDEALVAVRQGAFDFVLRPFFVEDISLTVACAAARRLRASLESPLGHVRKNHDLLR